MSTLTLITVSTLTDLGTTAGNTSTSILVTDLATGGVFDYAATIPGGVANGGTTFAAAPSPGGFWVRQIADGQGLNVWWFGAVADYTGTGTPTDNKTAIEATVAVLQEGQEIVIPEGDYYISSLNLNLPNNCKYTQKGTFYSSTTATAVFLGSTTTPVFSYYVRGLTVMYTSSDLSGTSIGVKIQNVYTSDIEIREVYGFGTGILIYADGHGNVYNKYYLGTLLDNTTSLLLDHTASGWVNENMFYGGHFTFSSLFAYASVHLNISDITTNPNNNNRFLFPSFESSVTGTLPKAAILGGEFNYILYPRYEFIGATSVTTAFEFAANSQYNEVIGGLNWTSTQILNSGTHNNWHGRDAIMQTGGTSGIPLLTLQSFNTSSAKLIDVLNSASAETFYVQGTGTLWSNDSGSFAKGIKLGTSTQVLLYGGSGSPQGSITANPGSMYFNTTGGNGTSIYVKESGSGTNTGWVPYASPPATGAFTANGGSSSYNIAHGLGSTPSYFTAVPTTTDAAGNFYLTANATNIIVNYLAAPASGTNNVKLNWQAKL